MKKIYLIILFTALSFSQNKNFNFGLFASINNSSIEIDNSLANSKRKFSGEIGILSNYNVNTKSFIRGKLSFCNYNSDYSYNLKTINQFGDILSSEVKSNMNNSYINIDVNYNYNIYKKIYLGTGIGYGYLVNSSKYIGYNNNNNNRTFYKSNFNKSLININIEALYSIKKNIIVGIEYKKGLNNLFNENNNSAFINAFCLNIYYTFK